MKRNTSQHVIAASNYSRKYMNRPLFSCTGEATMDAGKDDDKGPKVQCEICHEYMLKRSLQRHMQRRHTLSSNGRRSPSLESASTTAANHQLLRIARTGATLQRELERVYEDAAEAMLRAGGRHTRRQLEHFVAATFPGIPAECRQPLISGRQIWYAACVCKGPSKNHTQRKMWAWLWARGAPQNFVELP